MRRRPPRASPVTESGARRFPLGRFSRRPVVLEEYTAWGSSCSRRYEAVAAGLLPRASSSPRSSAIGIDASTPRRKRRGARSAGYQHAHRSHDPGRERDPTNTCNGEPRRPRRLGHAAAEGLRAGSTRQFTFQISWTPASPTSRTSDEVLTVNRPKGVDAGDSGVVGGRIERLVATRRRRSLRTTSASATTTSSPAASSTPSRRATRRRSP